jgi:hypothetical protein
MPVKFAASILLVLAAALLTMPKLARAQVPEGALLKPISKKGVGLSEKLGFGAPQLALLKVGWYYDWHTEPVASPVPFVPMIFSPKKVGAPVSGGVVLGFNEPDNEKQANIPVSEALAAWSQVAARAPRVGSPAMAGNPLSSPWLEEFMRASPKVDFITVHWYKGVHPEHFVRDLEAIHTKFGKPIWVTEFAPQTVAGSEREPGKYSQLQVDQFIAASVGWMERTPYVERYAWHDSRIGTSALFDSSGALTATGKAYAAAQ